MRSIGHANKFNWNSFRIRSATILLVGVSCASMLVFGSDIAATQNANELRSPSEFSSIQDPQTRSRALFTEAARS